MQKQNFGLIGCGRISQVHLSTLQKSARAELVAVADVERGAAESAAEAFGARAFTDPREMIESNGLDAVILCTPPNTHRELAQVALQTGAHVLCEKPLAITMEDAQAMLDAAREADRVLMMASKFRYVGDLVKARGILQSGILGELMAVENAFCARVDMSSRWNSSPEVAGGGVVIDNGTHSADIVRYLLGPVTQVFALEGRRHQRIEVEDNARLFLRVADRTIAAIDLSWSASKPAPHFLSVFGTEGTLQVGWQGSQYRQSDQLDWVSFGQGYDKFQAVGDQLENFVDVIEKKDSPLIDDDDALASVAVIQSAYRSLEKNCWEEVAS